MGRYSSGGEQRKNILDIVKSVSKGHAGGTHKVCSAPPTGQVSRTFKKSRLMELRLSPTSSWGDPGQGTHMIFL